MDRATQLYEESLAIANDLDDKAGAAATLSQLAGLAERKGDYGAASTLCERSMGICRGLGDKAGVARGLHLLGLIQHGLGRHHQALELYQQSIASARKLGDRFGMARAMGDAAFASEAVGDLRGALRGQAGALALLREAESPDAVKASRQVTRLRGKVGEEQFKKAWKEITGKEFEEKDLDAG